MKYDNFIDLHPNYITRYKYINSAYSHNLPRYLEEKEGKFSLLFTFVANLHGSIFQYHR